jgi:hypothetical protein
MADGLNQRMKILQANWDGNLIVSSPSEQPPATAKDPQNPQSDPLMNEGAERALTGLAKMSSPKEGQDSSAQPDPSAPLLPERLAVLLKTELFDYQLQKGDKAPKEHMLCPWKMIIEYPIHYIGKANTPRVGRRIPRR